MQSPESAAQLKALVVFTLVVGLIAGTLWVFLSPPDGAMEARSRLDPDKYPDPADRIKGVEMIRAWTLDGESLSGYQQLQMKGCKDPDSKVRVAALEALGAITAERPDMIVRSSGLGDMIYLDTDFLTNLGLTDPDPTVRIAAARYWERADVLSEKGISALTSMLDKETDGKVIAAAKESLARRLERGSQAGKIDAARARNLQARYQLRPVTLKE